MKPQPLGVLWRDASRYTLDKLPIAIIVNGASKSATPFGVVFNDKFFYWALQQELQPAQRAQTFWQSLLES